MATKKKRRKSFRDRDPVKVAIASIVVIVLVVIVAIAAGASRLITPGYTMAGVFEEAGEVQPGQPVSLSGIVVGSVTSVEPDFRKGTVVVRWSMHDGVELSQKARASISLLTPIGGRMLTMAGPSGGPFMSALPEKDRVIPIERTSTPVTINEILDEVVRLAEDLDEEAIADLLEEVVGITEENKEELKALLKYAGRLAAQIGKNAPQLQEILENGERITGLVQRKDKELMRMLQASSTLSQMLLDRQNQLRAVFGDSNRVINEMAGVLKRNRAQIKEFLLDLSQSWDATWESIPEWHAVWSWLHPIAQSALPIARQPAGYAYGFNVFGVNSIEGLLMPLRRAREFVPLEGQFPDIPYPENTQPEGGN